MERLCRYIRGKYLSCVLIRFVGTGRPAHLVNYWYSTDSYIHLFYKKRCAGARKAVSRYNATLVQVLYMSGKYLYLSCILLPTIVQFGSLCR